MVSPGTAIGLAAAAADTWVPEPDGLHVAVYRVTVDPLFELGVNETASDPVVVAFPARAATDVGAAGVPAMMAGVDAEPGPVPAAFTAATRKV